MQLPCRTLRIYLPQDLFINIDRLMAELGCLISGFLREASQRKIFRVKKVILKRNYSRGQQLITGLEDVNDLLVRGGFLRQVVNSTCIA